MKSIFTALLLLLSTQAAFAKSLMENRNNLKNFGITYCLSMNIPKDSNAEPNLALGGYFQRGRHDSPKAYDAIKGFFDSRSKAIKVYQETGAPAILMHCLDLGSSAEYARLVRMQDKYIAKYSSDE